MLFSEGGQGQTKLKDWGMGEGKSHDASGNCLKKKKMPPHFDKKDVSRQFSIYKGKRPVGDQGFITARDTRSIKREKLINDFMAQRGGCGQSIFQGRETIRTQKRCCDLLERERVVYASLGNECHL